MGFVASLTIGVYFLYALFMLYFFSGLYRLKNKPSINNSIFSKVSVIVAARNEEDNIGALLTDLSQQTYSQENLEIIIADDRSTDKTLSIIKTFTEKFHNIKFVEITEVSDDMTPKKHALSKAIEKSSAEIIISTDADCRVPKTWVENIIKTFTEETGIVVGYSKINVQSTKFFDHYQGVDFLALMSANAGSLGWGNPWTASGQNIAYRRSDFDRINGFKPVAQRISGDDHYLVQSISKIAQVQYNTSPGGFVQTKPMPNIHQFISQRIRWASNARNLFNSDWGFLAFLSINLFVNTIILVAFFNTFYWQYLPMLLGIKFLFDSAVLFYGSKLFETSVKLSAYLAWFFLQPIYIPLLAILSMFGKFRWKD